MTNDIFNRSLHDSFLYINFFFVTPCLFGYKYRIRYTTPAKIMIAMAVKGQCAVANSEKRHNSNMQGINRYVPDIVMNGLCIL
jgi:hypothetical protein